MKRILILFILFMSVLTAYTQNKFKEVNTAEDVIDNYVTAIGGAEKISEINSETLTGMLNVQGMEIGFTTFRNDTMSFINAEGMAHGTNMILLKSLTTNTFGWEYQMNGLRDYEGDELLKKQRELITGNISFVLNYKSKGYEFELKGTDTLNGKLCYKVELLKDGNVVRTSYYDHKTFLLKEYFTSNDTRIEFDDYREVSGVYRPFKFIQKSPMELTIVFNEYFFNKMIDPDLLSKPADK